MTRFYVSCSVMHDMHGSVVPPQRENCCTDIWSTYYPRVTRHCGTSMATTNALSTTKQCIRRAMHPSHPRPCVLRRPREPLETRNQREAEGQRGRQTAPTVAVAGTGAATSRVNAPRGWSSKGQAAQFFRPAQHIMNIAFGIKPMRDSIPADHGRVKIVPGGGGALGPPPPPTPI